MGTSILQFADAQISGPIALLYGVGWVRGNQLALHQLANKDRIVCVGLGEGEWDGINSLIINKEFVDHTDTTKFHFHPGIDGELGHGLAADSTGGDQRVDTFWSELPAAAKKVTFSRLTNLWMKIAADPKAPSADLDWIGEYRGLKLRIFDNAGTQTSRAHSTNATWQLLDAIIRYKLKRDALVAATLSTDEKARFDWPSIADDAAVFCNYDIGGGIKRVETSFAFPQRVPLRQVIDQIRTASRLIVQEVAGKIYIRSEAARAYSFTLTSKHVIPGSWQPSKRDIRGAPNRFIGRFNDLNLAKVATIDTVGNSGAVRTGGNLVTIKTTTNHGFKSGDKYTTQGIAEATMNAERVAITYIDPNEFSYASAGANGTSGGGTVRSPYSKFAQRSVIKDHEQHQNFVGQRGLALTAQPAVRPVEIDFGNNTFERVSRLLKFISARTLGEDVSPYHAPVGPQVRVIEEAVDAGDNLIAMQLVGDVIKVDRSVSEEDQGDYEILDVKRDPNGAGEGLAAYDLTLSEKVTAAYTDVADDEPDTMATQSVATVLTPIGSPNSVGKIVVPTSTVLNPQGSINPILMGAGATMGVGYDATGPYITVTVTAGDIPQPDGTTISVPASGPTTYRNWAGAAVTANTLYGLNVVWDVATAAVQNQELLGAVTLAFKALAFRDGKIPIVYGAYNTTPVVQGGGGGAGGGGSPCFSGNTEIIIPGGTIRIADCPRNVPFDVITRFGVRKAKLIVHQFKGLMCDMGLGELVTGDHRLRTRDQEEWWAARLYFEALVPYEGEVFNLFIMDAADESENHYTLKNGLEAHNGKEA